MNTYASLGATLDRAEKWRSTITQAAFDYSFLMNEIFAFTSLHIHSTSRNPIDLKRALEYHETAGSIFQSHNDSLTRDNHVAVWGFAVINVMFTLAIPQWQSDLTYIHSIVAYANLLRGLAIIDHKSETWMSETLPDAKHPGESSSKAEFSEDNICMLSKVRDLVGIATCADYLIRMYEDAVSSLEAVCRAADQEPTALLIWPCTQQILVFSEFEDGSYLATALFLYWGAMLQCMLREGKWWTASIGRLIVEELSSPLAKSSRPPECMSLVSWARNLVGLPPLGTD